MFRRNFLLCFIAILSNAHASNISLDDYLSQVRGGNTKVKATENFMIAADLQRSRSKVITSINAFSLIQTESDRKQPQFADFEGTSRLKRTFQLGLEQNSSYGVTHKLYTNYAYINQKEASFIPNPEVANSAVIYEFNVPLLKNFFGKNVKLEQESILAQKTSEYNRETFEQRKILNEAKSLYWKLKTAQEIVKSQEEMIKQGEKFLSWTKTRVRDRLSDESDLGQAEAILDLRRFDLQKEKIELLKAEQNFNSYRQIDVSESIPELEGFPADHLLPELPSEEQALKRPDLISLEAQLKSETLEYEKTAENSKMEINLIGSAASNGLSYGTEPAYSKTFSGKYPAYVLGLKLSLPLDRESVDDVQKASLAKKTGLEAALKRNRYESLVGLSQLKLDYQQLLLQLKIVRNLARSQEKKLEAERTRMRFGRTSTFQLLTFEQDFQQAKQDLIRTQGQLWQLTGQLSLYRNEGI